MPKRKNGNPKNGKARKKKDEYDVIVINPTIDAAFTFFMYAELLFSLYVFAKSQDFRVSFDLNNLEDFEFFILCLLGTTFVVYAIRKFASTAGPLLSRTVLKNEPFNDPLKAPKSREKFTSQFLRLHS